MRPAGPENAGCAWPPSVWNLRRGHALGKWRWSLVAICAAASLLAGCRAEDSPPAAGQIATSHAVATGQAARSKPFLASVAREPYHRSTCRWAVKIDAGNLVGYDTAAEAVADGRRPCQVCKPNEENR
jgi:hypothetical protein